ncbi:hypothetical protein COEREDRAFT_6325 [Coemansia reversa NRRL 1564]|uniref:GST N-terminal domain-containing protein n=1 Tax=Coemansia reversa (strain ATCC 12441 / NRRL 1564) TaxID=763665 RepID=A0A2G5BIM7_COERN|nr:hypothetical protein COEREDRAFT_6325 [Coemansia reversa NRRL 1564]|eukprot:PIA18617.1 hypothetical protein COEREDRAFT_6325 [Coemansia reversa NRRL 1564]
MFNNNTPSYILRYFNRVGLGESVKMMLTVANVEWIEENPKWPEEKSKQPFGHLPVLIEKNTDGKADFVICESGCIERYLARRYGLLPANFQQAALQEQARDQMSDVLKAFISHLFAEGEEDILASWRSFNEILDIVIFVQTKLLRANGNTGRFFGKNLSYADIVIYAVYKIITIGWIKNKPDIVDILKPKLTPELLKLISTVEFNPQLARYTTNSISLVAVLTM